MAIVGLDANFIEYLRMAPERVKIIVENMLPSEYAKNELKAECEKSESRYSYAEEDVEQVEVSSFDERDNAKDSPGSAPQDEKNLYIDMDFSKRLEIDELRVKISSDDVCYVHSEPFEKIQVVLLFGGGKKYGSYLKCCPKCKKLFIKEDDFKELEIRLKEKNIKYSIER